MEEPALNFFTAFQKLAIALGLGLLFGLQRERSRSRVAGVRTFAFLTILGAVCGLLGRSFGGWVVGLGVVAVALLLVIANLTKIVADQPDPGMTTEMAALTMYGVGAYLTVGHTGIAIALGGAASKPLVVLTLTPLKCCPASGKAGIKLKDAAGAPDIPAFHLLNRFATDTPIRGRLAPETARLLGKSKVRAAFRNIGN